jgi:hypothetical protein
MIQEHLDNAFMKVTTLKDVAIARVGRNTEQAFAQSSIHLAMHTIPSPTCTTPPPEHSPYSAYTTSAQQP